MKEREIRQILHKVCRDLDARAAVVPAVAGAISLAVGCGGEAEPGYAAPFIPEPDAGGDDAKADQLDAADEPELGLLYMAPLDAADEDAGAIPPYMAVPPDSGDEDSGPVPDYMAVPPDASDEDAGPMPPYMGVPPDFDE